MARAESGSITQLGKNRWRVRVSGGNDPVTGKRIRLSKVVHGTKKDAIAERTRMQIEVGDVDRATKGMTVAEYFDEVYMPWYKTKVRKTSYIAAESKLRVHVIPSIGHIPLAKLSAYTTETWIEGVEGKAAPYGVFTFMKSAYKQAFNWGMVPRNIFDKLTPPKKECGEKIVANAELAAMIIEAMHDEYIEPIFLLEVSCGLRYSEAVALDWEDIDFRTGKVSIHRSYQHVNGEGAQFFDTKNSRSVRKVSVPKGVLDRLLEIRCAGGKVRFGPLCEGRYEGSRMAPVTFRQQYKRIYAEKLPDQPYITPRNLRHTHATILLKEKVDLKTIADRLGHANVATTTKFYIQPVEELDVEASDIFDSAIKVAKPHEESEANVIEFRPAQEA